jgi:hypothetical protein
MTTSLKYQSRGISRGPLATHGAVPSQKTQLFYGIDRNAALQKAFEGIKEDEVRVAAWNSSSSGYRQYNVLFKLDGQVYVQTDNADVIAVNKAQPLSSY